MICGTGLGRDNNDLDHTDWRKLLLRLCKDPNRPVVIHVETPLAEPWGTNGDPFKQWLELDCAKNLGDVTVLDYSGYAIGRLPDHDESWAILEERAPKPSKVTKLDLR
jgi:hypothetical protein